MTTTRDRRGLPVILLVPLLTVTGALLLVVLYLLGLGAWDAVTGAETEHSPFGVVLFYAPLWATLTVLSVLALRSRRR